MPALAFRMRLLALQLIALVASQRAVVASQRALNLVASRQRAVLVASSSDGGTQRLSSDYYRLGFVIGDQSLGGHTYVSELYLNQDHFRRSAGFGWTANLAFVRPTHTHTHTHTRAPRPLLLPGC